MAIYYRIAEDHQFYFAFESVKIYASLKKARNDVEHGQIIMAFPSKIDAQMHTNGAAVESSEPAPCNINKKDSIFIDKWLDLAKKLLLNRKRKSKPRFFGFDHNHRFIDCGYERYIERCCTKAAKSAGMSPLLADEFCLCNKPEDVAHEILWIHVTRKVTDND